jgi:hypothetical protein
MSDETRDQAQRDRDAIGMLMGCGDEPTQEPAKVVTHRQGRRSNRPVPGHR